MAVVHAEKPWDYRFQLYGGHVCNTLMAGKFSSSTSVVLSLPECF